MQQTHRAIGPLVSSLITQPTKLPHSRAGWTYVITGRYVSTQSSDFQIALRTNAGGVTLNARLSASGPPPIGLSGQKGAAGDLWWLWWIDPAGDAEVNIGRGINAGFEHEGPIMAAILQNTLRAEAAVSLAQRLLAMLP